MKFDRAELIKAIERVKPALQASGSIPQLKHIWLDGKFLYAYNGALGIRINWPTEIPPCGIPGTVLLGLLQSTSAKEVEFDASATTQAELKMNKATATLPLMQSDLNPWPFPLEVPAGPVGVRTLILTDELITGLKQACIIKAAKPNRVEHYGVVLFPAKDSVVLYTTDSKSLAEVSVAQKVSKDLKKAVLPFGFVAQLLDLKPGSKVSFTQDSIIAEAEGIMVGSNLLDSSSVWDLPDLVDKTIAGHGGNAGLPEGTGEALGRALVMAGSDLENQWVSLTTAGKSLQIAGKLTHGMLKEKLALTIAPGDGEIQVGLEHLKSLLKGAEEFAIAKKALMLYGKGEALYLISAHEGK